MKIITLLLSCLLGAGISCQAQELVPFLKDSLYGFMDSKGMEVVEPQYENVSHFGSQHFLADKGEKKSGRHSPHYKDRKSIKLAHVKEKGQWNVINRKGEKLLASSSDHPFTISRLSYMNFSVYISSSYRPYIPPSVVQVKNGGTGHWCIFYLDSEERSTETYIEKWGRYSRSGIGPKHPDNYLIAENQSRKSWDLIDVITGEVILGKMLDIREICFEYYYYQTPDKKWYTYNCQTKTSVHIPYDLYALHLESGATKTGRFDKRDKRDCKISYYIVGPKGKEVKPAYYKCYNLGLADEASTLILDTVYHRIDIRPNYIIATKKNPSTEKTQAYLFNRKGDTIATPPYLSLSYVMGDKFIAGLESGAFVLLDSLGQLVSNNTYEKLTFYNGYIKCLKFKNGGEQGFVDLDGNELISYPCDDISLIDGHIDAQNIVTAFYKVEEDDKVGLIANDKKYIHLIEYKSISMIYRERKFILLEEFSGHFGVSDAAGKILIPIKYDEIKKQYDKNSEYHLVCYMDGKEVKRYDKDMVRIEN